MKYLVWRAGKPRWSPGPDLRARGFKGQDLKYSSGEWMRLGDATAAAKALNDRAGRPSEVPADIAEREAALDIERGREPGFVYFLFAEQRVKIGFSTAPLTRGATIKTASGLGVDAFAFVPGTMSDEKAIHDLLAANRISGEWFYASQPAMNVMLRSLRRRRATVDASPL